MRVFGFVGVLGLGFLGFWVLGFGFIVGFRVKGLRITDCYCMGTAPIQYQSVILKDEKNPSKLFRVHIPYRGS